MKSVQKQLRIGILGGTFDPIHKGHLELARAAKKFLKLDKVYFVPAKISPFKKHQRITSASLRLKMVRLATKGISWAEVSDVELKRTGVSYSINTVRFFQKKFCGGACLYIVMGADAFNSFPKWREAKEIIRSAKIAVAGRPGAERILSSWPYIGIPMKKIPLSSTNLRNQLKRSPSGLSRSVAQSIPIPVNVLKNLLKKKNFLHNYLTR